MWLESAEQNFVNRFHVDKTFSVFRGINKNSKTLSLTHATTPSLTQIFYSTIYN